MPVNPFLPKNSHKTNKVCEKEGKKGYVVSYDGMKYQF